MPTFKSNRGFSIEIEGFKLEPRGLHEDLPLFESNGGVITAIAIVDDPAIERGFVTVDEEQMIIGPIMVPNHIMYRQTEFEDGTTVEYFVYFSAKTIRELKETFKGQVKLGH